MNRIGLDAGLIPPLRESVSTIMLSVILALMPGTLLYIGFINSQMAINVLIACTTALLIEALMLRLRRRSMAALTDGSIIVAAWLLALCLPPTLPAWQLIVGVSVMTTLGKHVFGGLGHNPFNPAMVAYAFLIISFPGSMTNWELQSGFFSPASNNISTRTTDKAIEVEQAIDFSSTDSMAEDASTTQWDSITRATPLDRLRQLRHESRRQDSGELPVDDQRESQPGNVAAGKALIALNIAWLLGGLFLLYRRIISWHIPVSVLGSVLAIYSIYALWTPAFVLGPISALFSGAIIFGAFFIATDPVSCATSRYGKLVYGMGLGVLCVVIREFSAYPEGFAFAVLLMNICVPLIDYTFTRSNSTNSALINTAASQFITSDKSVTSKQPNKDSDQ